MATKKQTVKVNKKMKSTLLTKKEALAIVKLMEVQQKKLNETNKLINKNFFIIYCVCCFKN